MLRNARLPGGAAVELRVVDGKLDRVGTVPPGEGKERDLGGAFVVPAVIDSHVHLVYWAVGEELLDHGVVAAVDLAAPEGTPVDPAGPRLRSSGPMVTAVGGYPTTSWGAGGYGIECPDAAAAEAAVRRLVGGGAAVVKIPLQAPALSDEALRRAIDVAHELGVPVAVHALTDAEAARGAAFGADLLAHTPVEPLGSATVAGWSGKAVVSTLAAFGGAPGAVDNLRALRAAGATVLYGTDLGNLRTAGVDREELRLLQAAGLDGAAILDAATRVPAERWGWRDLGALAEGHAASFLVVARDPLDDPLVLADPVEVWIDGVRR